MGMQLDWRFCQKCTAMFFDGFAGKGICPAGGGHVSQGFMFALPYDIPETPTSQGAWRFCPKCSTMHFDGRPDKGHCAAGGAHVSQGFIFALPHDIPETPTSQGAWTFCRNCTSMFYNGRPDKGHCPANGGGHVGDASFGFVLPHDIPMVLDFNFAPIVFGSGIAAGGNAHLTLRSDGSYTFSGHFHDSGGAEYNTALAWVVKDSQNRVYTFQHAGHIAGTFESGSRDDNWTVDSRNDQLAANWANLGASATATARAEVNVDLVNLTNALIGAVGLVVGVIGIVVAVPAAPAA